MEEDSTQACLIWPDLVAASSSPIQAHAGNHPSGETGRMLKPWRGEGLVPYCHVMHLMRGVLRVAPSRRTSVGYVPMRCRSVEREGAQVQSRRRSSHTRCPAGRRRRCAPAGSPCVATTELHVPSGGGAAEAGADRSWRSSRLPVFRHDWRSILRRRPRRPEVALARRAGKDSQAST